MTNLRIRKLSLLFYLMFSGNVWQKITLFSSFNHIQRKTYIPMLLKSVFHSWHFEYHQVYKLYFLDCGERKEQKKKKKKKKEELRDTMLSDKIEWMIRCDTKPVTGFLSKKFYQSRVFYSGTPGYRLQLYANIDRQEAEIFFCLRVLKGAYDEDLEWPCQQRIRIKSSEKMHSNRIEYCFTPENDALKRPKIKNDKIYTKWIGPFNLSHYLGINDLIFDIYLG